MNLRLILSALVVFSVCGTIFLFDSRREDDAAGKQFAREMLDLGTRFPLEKERILSQLPLRSQKPSPSPSEILTELAHSKSVAYGFKTTLVANDDSRLAQLLDEKTSRTPGTSQKLFTKSWEGFPATLQFEKIPSLNAFLVVEKVHTPVKGSARMSLLKKIMLVSGSLFGVLLLSFGLGLWRNRNQEEIFSDSPTPAPSVTPPVVRGLPQRLQQFRAPPQSEFAQFITRRLSPPGPSPKMREVARTQQERQWLEEFGISAGNAKDPTSIEISLVTTTAKATQMPALFFRYDVKQGILKLSAQAGLPSSLKTNEAAASFALSADVVTEIHVEEKNGKKRDLSDQAALVKLLRRHFRISSFDAWPMVQSRRGALLGVLVVAHSRVDSPVDAAFIHSLSARFQGGSARLFR